MFGWSVDGNARNTVLTVAWRLLRHPLPPTSTPVSLDFRSRTKGQNGAIQIRIYRVLYESKRRFIFLTILFINNYAYYYFCILVFIPLLQNADYLPRTDRFYKAISILCAPWYRSQMQHTPTFYSVYRFCNDSGGFIRNRVLIIPRFTTHPGILGKLISFCQWTSSNRLFICMLKWTTYSLCMKPMVVIKTVTMTKVFIALRMKGGSFRDFVTKSVWYCSLSLCRLRLIKKEHIQF